MKRTYILAGMILALSLSAFGQKQKSTPDDQGPKSKSTSKNGNSGQIGSNSGADASSLLSAGTTLQAQLESVIDVRKSQVGDQVVLKTTKAIKQNGEVIVPKGANLIGRITEIKRKTKDDATSKVGMVFERIQGKNLDIPVNASIMSVVTGSAGAAAGDLFAADAMGSGSASGSAAARPSTGGGGGLLGGGGSTVGGLVNTTTSTVGNVAGSAVNTVEGTTGTVGRTVNGLQISQSASGSANSSSNISAQGKDVRVEKGARFNLRLDGSARGQE